MLPPSFRSIRGASVASGLALTLLVAACAQQGPPSGAERANSSADAASMAAEEAAMRGPVAEGSPASAPAVSGAGQVHADDLGSQAGMSSDPARHFKVHASARFQVDDVHAVGNRIEDAAIAAGGFVLDNAIGTDVQDVHVRALGDGTRVRLSEVRTTGTLTVRMPVAATSRFLRSLADQMVFLDERRFQAQDMQFEMLRRQLAWVRHEQLQADAARAGTQPARVSDTLDAADMRAHALLQRDEARVSQSELEDAVAFSTVQLHLYQDAQVRRQVEPDTDALMA